MGQRHSSATPAQEQQLIHHQATMSKAGIELATFGAGCFWGTEKFFKKQFGGALASTVVGYM